MPVGEEPFLLRQGQALEMNLSGIQAKDDHPRKKRKGTHTKKTAQKEDSQEQLGLDTRAHVLSLHGHLSAAL